MNPKDYGGDAEEIKEKVSTHKYYEIFDVDEKASQTEINKATVEFLKKYPIRTYPEIFKLVSRVMFVLKNPDERKKYDKERYILNFFDELFKGEKRSDAVIDLAEMLERIVMDDLESFKRKGKEYILQQIKENRLCRFHDLEVSTVGGEKHFTLDSHSFSFCVPEKEKIKKGDLVLASDGGHECAIVTVKIKEPPFINTWWDIMSRPGAFFKGMPTSGGYGEPLKFALINFLILGIACTIFGLDNPFFGIGKEFGWLKIIATPIVGLIEVFVLSIILLIGFKIFGGSGSYGGAVRVVSYASAAMALAWIPVINILASLYGLYLLILGGKYVHNV